MRKGQKSVDVFTHNGKVLTALAWAKELGIPKHVFYQRLKKFSDENLIYHKGLFKNLKMKRTTHGWSKTPTYQSWYDMVKRCSEPTNNGWKNYGGRGITMCPRWRIFKNFLLDMGEKPEGLTLDRKNNNGNYFKRNCRWATPIMQGNNTRRNVHLLIDNNIMGVKEAAHYLGITQGALYSRLSKQRLQKRHYGLQIVTEKRMLKGKENL